MNAQPWTVNAVVVVPQRRAGVVESEFEGELTLYDPSNAANYYLSATAASVWRSCNGSRSTHDLARNLVGTYDITFPQALADVEQLVAAFAEAGLLGDTGSEEDGDE
jgi:hypothetical protein